MNSETSLVARKVNDLIKEYVSIEDDVFKPSIRKSLPIPGIFRPIHYLSHVERLAEMENEVDQVKNLIRSLKPENESMEGQFLITLRAYSSAFLDAMTSLKLICRKLHEKSRGEVYPRKEYETDAKELRKVEMKYFEIGKKLNDQLKEIGSQKEEQSFTSIQ